MYTIAGTFATIYLEMWLFALHGSVKGAFLWRDAIAWAYLRITIRADNLNLLDDKAFNATVCVQIIEILVTSWFGGYAQINARDCIAPMKRRFNEVVYRQR
jgi:hypothetical protein